MVFRNYFEKLFGSRCMMLIVPICGLIEVLTYRSRVMQILSIFALRDFDTSMFGGGIVFQEMVKLI